MTPNPIEAATIQPSTIAVEIVDFSRPPPTASKPARANLNTLYHINDGSGRIFTNDSRGKVWELDPGTGVARPFLDLLTVRGANLVKNTRQTGLRSFAFHPDFSKSGQPGFRKFYTISTETVASRPASTPLLPGAPTTTLFHDVLCEWSADSTGQVIVTGTRREILRIPEWGSDHNADQLMFDPNAREGDSNYGMLFITVADGSYANPGDPFSVAQDQTLILGKILRINPLGQSDGGSYGIPSDNPLVGQSGSRPEIWAIGFRHPRNISFDRGGNGTLFISDIGQSNIEEINIGVKGGNYGWSFREGTFVTDRANGRVLYALPDDDPPSFVYPVAQYDHTEGKAVAGGFVYRGTAAPALQGQYVFGDIVRGRIFHASVAEMEAARENGSQAAVQELRLLQNGSPTTMLQLVGTSNPPGRVDLAFGQDEAGEVYVLSKQDGVVRKFRTA